jgi:hypothetical protein
VRFDFPEQIRDVQLDLMLSLPKPGQINSKDSGKDRATDKAIPKRNSHSGAR